MSDPSKIGEQWGAEAQDWATIQEPTSIPLWNAMLDATRVGKGTKFLDAGCAAGHPNDIAIEIKHHTTMLKDHSSRW